MRYLALLLLVFGPAMAELPDLDCRSSGDELEVEPLTAEARAWLDQGGFWPWAWVDGRRQRIQGPFSPGFRNGEAFLLHAQAIGLEASPRCWQLARRYPPQN